MRRQAYYINHLDEMQELLNQFTPGIRVRSLSSENHNMYGVVLRVDRKARQVYVSWNGGSHARQHDPDELIVDIDEQRLLSARIADELFASNHEAASQETMDLAAEVSSTPEFKEAMDKAQTIMSEVESVRALLSEVGIRAEDKLWKDIGKLVNMSAFKEMGSQ